MIEPRQLKDCVEWRVARRSITQIKPHKNSECPYARSGPHGLLAQDTS